MKDFNYLKQQMLYHKIVKWEENTIVLDNGLTLSIASFIVRPVNEEKYIVDFVASSDDLLEREEE